MAKFDPSKFGAVEEQAPQQGVSVPVSSKSSSFDPSKFGAVVETVNTTPKVVNKSNMDKTIGALGIFGGETIGKAIGNKIAKNRFEKEPTKSSLTPAQIKQAEETYLKRTGKSIDFSANKTKQDILESDTFKGPSGKAVAGDIGRSALNFIPVGKIASVAGTGLKALPVIGKAAKPIANIGTGLAVGYTGDVTNKLATEQERPFTPGVGTAIGGILPAAPYVARGAGRLVGEGLGVSTGTGYGAIKEGFNAALEGGKRAEDFQTALRGSTTPEQIVQEAKDSLGKIIQDKRNSYQTQLADIAKDTTKLDISPINNEVKSQLNKFGIKNNNGVLDFSQSTLRFNKSAQTDIQTIVDEMRVFGSRKGDRTAVGVDSLKRAFQDLYSPSGEARAFVEGVRKTTLKVLDNVPGYNELTSSYRSKNGLIEDIYKGLSLGDKASTDTAFRKLTTALRTNNEVRKELIAELDRASGGFLSSKVAGQQLGELLPRGIVKAVGGVGAVGAIAAGSLPPVLKAALFTSPRLVGEMINAAGITGRKATQLLDILQKNAGKLQFPGDAIIDRINP